MIVFFAIISGTVHIPLHELFFKENRQIVILRILRLFLAMSTGSGLAVSGIALQAVLRNPLAEPYLLGTSSGAGLSAVLAILAGLGMIYVPIAAFIGAALSVVMVYFLAKQGGRVQTESLILSGVIVSVALSAIMVFLISIFPDRNMHGILWWLWGSLQVYDVKLLIVVSVSVLIGTTGIFVLSQDLNAISLGDEEAVHLGVKTETAKKIIFALSTLITSSVVCVAGIIGFVGLIVPHIMRLIVGPNHKILIPASCVAGAAFMIISDVIARSIFPPLEIPIGVITALIGAPVFVFLLKRNP